MESTHHCPQFRLFSTDLKRIQTPKSLFRDLGLDKSSVTRCFKFESMFEPLPLAASHLAITLHGYSRRKWKFMTGKSIAERLGQRFCTAWEGWSRWTGKHKHREFPCGGSYFCPQQAARRKSTTLVILT